MNITFQGETFELADGESVLDGLLRKGYSVPHGCRGGACQSCMLHVEDGQVPAQAQVGLQSSQKQDGFFLSCCCYPQQDLAVSAGAPPLPVTEAAVLFCDRLSHQVVQVRLRADIRFTPGQYVNVWLDSNSVRSYSIASLPSDGFIELHVKLIHGGRFSTLLTQGLEPGSSLRLQGPLGSCVYQAERPAEDMLLIGCGTGLAPLCGVVRDALQHHHSGRLHLVVAARDSHGFYLSSNLRELESRHPNLQITFVCQTETPSLPGGVQADIYSFIKDQYPSTKNMQIFICGGEAFVRKLKKQCFLAGAAIKDIRSDAFSWLAVKPALG